MTNYQRFTIPCVICGSGTNKAYARAHDGKCKACATGIEPPTREQRIIDSGYQAYAREEGHYDIPDNY